MKVSPRRLHHRLPDSTSSNERRPRDRGNDIASMHLIWAVGLHKRAVEAGLEIVYPLTDEPWGVRRFFVVDPNGTILNIPSHLPAGSK